MYMSMFVHCIYFATQHFKVNRLKYLKYFSSSLQMVTRTKKIFVGGLSAPTTLEDVKSYFEQFGPVSDLRKYIEYCPGDA